MMTGAGRDTPYGSGLLEVGFYGKLPSHGDFLRRRVSDAFVGVWDGWLQECIAASRAALGARWLDVYLTSPAWRFVCAADVCGPQPVAGVMVPSVDRVGRYFPLAVVAELPADVSPLTAAADGAGFFDAAARLMTDALAAEPLDFDGFDEQVSRLGAHFDAVMQSSRAVLDAAAAIVLDDAHAAWHVPVGSPVQLCEQLAARRLATVYDTLGVWWTDGSAAVEPSCLVLRGLPHPEAFTALLDGSWRDHRWQSVPLRPHPGASLAAAETLVDEIAPPRFRSSAATDVGCVREINEDAFVERTDVGIWAVADGLGGHSDGEVASRMVCDALAELVPEAGFPETIETVRDRLARVNEHLIRAGTRPLNPCRSGSTVVTLLTRGGRCAVLWAGDSRAYRLRDGRLEQLTRDHSLAEAGAFPGSEMSHAVTRAIGGEPTLALDIYRDRVRAGDRFLLCSDGLTRTVSDDEIQRWLSRDDIRQSVRGLVQSTLDAGAPDNVTVLVVEAIA